MDSLILATVTNSNIDSCHKYISNENSPKYLNMAFNFFDFSKIYESRIQSTGVIVIKGNEVERASP